MKTDLARTRAIVVVAALAAPFVTALITPAVSLAAADAGQQPTEGPWTAWVLPPGHETEVQRFLQPLALGADAGDGWVLHNISIDHDHIALAFTSAAAGTANLELVHASAAAAGDRVAGPVAIRAPAGTPEPLLKAVSAAMTARAAADAPWVSNPKPVLKPGIVPMAPDGAGSPRRPWLVPAAALGALVVWVLARVAGRKKSPEPPAA